MYLPTMFNPPVERASLTGILVAHSYNFFAIGSTAVVTFSADQAGEYQIGEVKARSWWVWGTFAGIFSLKRTWS